MYLLIALLSFHEFHGWWEKRVWKPISILRNDCKILNMLGQQCLEFIMINIPPHRELNPQPSPWTDWWEPRTSSTQHSTHAVVWNSFICMCLQTFSVAVSSGVVDGGRRGVREEMWGWEEVEIFWNTTNNDHHTHIWGWEEVEIFWNTTNNDHHTHIWYRQQASQVGRQAGRQASLPPPKQTNCDRAWNC